MVRLMLVCMSFVLFILMGIMSVMAGLENKWFLMINNLLFSGLNFYLLIYNLKNYFKEKINEH